MINIGKIFVITLLNIGILEEVKLYKNRKNYTILQLMYLIVSCMNLAYSKVWVTQIYVCIDIAPVSDSSVYWGQSLCQWGGVT